MSTIRTTIMSVVLSLVVAAAIYFTAAPRPVMAAQPGASCPVIHPSATSLSTEELWKILNGRYERSVGLPY
jgi:hypothetical protein